MEITKRTSEEFEKMKKEIERSLEEKMISFDADKAKLFAFANYQLKEPEGEATWLAIAIEKYAKARQEALVRSSVDLLNTTLTECKKLKESDKQEIKKCLPFIPETLNKEKKQIEEKLKKLPEETMEQSETRPN